MNQRSTKFLDGDTAHDGYCCKHQQPSQYPRKRIKARSDDYKHEAGILSEKSLSRLPHIWLDLHQAMNQHIPGDRQAPRANRNRSRI
jgi:hypothetical protein